MQNSQLLWDFVKDESHNYVYTQHQYSTSAIIIKFYINSLITAKSYLCMCWGLLVQSSFSFIQTKDKSELLLLMIGRVMHVPLKRDPLLWVNFQTERGFMWGQGGPDNHKTLSSGHISLYSTPQVTQRINFLYFVLCPSKIQLILIL